MVDTDTERPEIPGGLRTQLLLGLLILVVGTMALVAVVGAHLSRRAIERTELERVRADARVLAELERADSPRPLVESFRQHAGLRFARFATDDETSDYGTLPEAEEGRPLDGLLPDAESNPAARTVRSDAEAFAAAALSGTLERSSGGSDRWRAVALRSLRPAYERVAGARRMLWTYLAVDALFILIVGYAFFTYVVVRPVRAIGVATERAARGDLASPIELLPPNEFGRVGRSFNRMLEDLRQNRRQLRERLDELDEAYRELEETQESLIRSEKMASVGQLAAGVAHEIGNPLSAISGYLDFLQDMDLDEGERAELVERMQAQVDRIQTIIGDLLDFSRDDSAQPIEPIDLPECVDAAVDLLRPQPRSRDVAVEVDLGDDPPEILGNRDQVVQVLINLLMNAADAIKRDGAAGEIRISAEPRVDRVRLAVTDDGAGIPPDEQGRIFDPFYTTKDPGEGTGLGLAIAHRIMERFDGGIDVESEPGEGTTIRLEFRRADAPTSSSSTPVPDGD